MDEHEKMMMYKKEMGKQSARAMAIVFVGLPLALWVIISLASN